MTIRISIVLAILITMLAPEGAGRAVTLPSEERQAVQARVYLPAIMAPGCAGRSIKITSRADSGPGSLRQALLDAKKGDVITFDSQVFPPAAPKAINLLSSLPPLMQDCLTIDASQAGVILDGSASQNPVGLNIDSQANTIRGLQIVHFSGPAIMLNETARNNQIGGNPSIGSGPTGQGNRLSLNGVGVGVNGAKYNRLEGNLIGLDEQGSGLQVNPHGGIFLNRGAAFNTIGPGNQIAVSGVPAIEIQCAECTGNIVSQVRITSDLDRAIVYTGAAAAIRPDTPTIMEYDLSQGIATGYAAPGSTVEVYSYQEGGSTLFEGAAKASASGYFALDALDPFSGPGLTALAIEPGQGVTPFSDLLVGESRHLEMQQGNPLDKYPIAFLPSSSTNPSWIGETFSDVNASQMPEPTGLADFSRRNGHSWIRMSFSEFSWYGFLQTGHYSPLAFDEYHDQVIQSFVDNDIAVLYNLTFFDPQIVTYPGYVRFKDEAEIQRYLDYVHMIVTRYAGKIAYYETWNEADLAHVDDQQSLDLADYLSVVRRLIPVIRAADPQARIVLGGSSAQHDPPAQAYLPGLLQSDLMPLVDGIALHPMYGDSPDYERFHDYYYNYDTMIENYKQMAAAHGFTGEWFAEEMVWRVQENVVINEPEYYSHPVAVKYYARGITINRGLGVYPGIGGEDHEAVAGQVSLEQRMNTLLTGVQPAQVGIQVDQPSIRLRSYAFSLPGSGVMVALWNDITAADYDPGTPVTVTVDGLSAGSVTGKDPLLNYQQVLLKENFGGDTVIEGFLIKDYPQFIILDDL